MKDEDILDFLARDVSDLSCAELTTALASVLASCGVPSFALARVARPDAEISDYIMTGRYSEAWRDTYTAKNYGAVDPVVRYLRRSNGPFRWRVALQYFQDDPSFSKMNRMMQDAASHGLADGYVFPVQYDRGLAGYLTVGGPSCDLSILQVALLDAVARRVFWPILRQCWPEIAEELTAAVSVQLTRREMEALAWLADGMTSNEIGKVLNISSNTVDWYMSGIQEKLSARNRHHAVAIAFRLGLIN